MGQKIVIPEPAIYAEVDWANTNDAYFEVDIFIGETVVRSYQIPRDWALGANHADSDDEAEKMALTKFGDGIKALMERFL